MGDTAMYESKIIYHHLRTVDLGVPFPQIPFQWASIQREGFSVPRHDKNKA